MLRCCVLEFEGNWEKYLPLVEFAYNNSFQSSIKMAPYEALYEKIHGVDLIQETEDKVKVIRDNLKAASDRQKSYGQSISESMSVLRFGRKGKLSPSFIRPYEIIEKIGPVAYCLVLPSELEEIQNVFHVSMLRRYRSYPSHVISLTDIEIQPGKGCNEELIRILAREVKELRNKCIALVNVLWQRHGVKEAT
ncbi:DNA/RNA polymerases superfamily protein [Gossypium australe]|uniref:DNA/RNA polymerases superfamily protein n=1 Tax=Gossypium australe TaxID=47621 RepID=A0A5B6WRX2_9ROSI|nr:DNA/RNA polymerases superfamily protein [Gossypium australe]